MKDVVEVPIEVWLCTVLFAIVGLYAVLNIVLSVFIKDEERRF